MGNQLVTIQAVYKKYNRIIFECVVTVKIEVSIITNDLIINPEIFIIKKKSCINKCFSSTRMSVKNT